ncbi:MAG TPA: tetratricopeptide repeat protein [bacterium]|nr:tetratricopeptide repeat protein [bacterium]
MALTAAGKIFKNEGVRWGLTVLGLAVVVAGSTWLRRSLWSDDTLMVSDAAFRYRLARMYAQGETPPERDFRVMPPEGQPLHDDLLLVEDALVGWTYRLFHTGYDEASFSDHLALWVSFVSSLGAGAVFLLGYALWRRRSLALAAALIAVFAVASVDRTVNVYLREHLAVPFALLGWAGMLGALGPPSDDSGWRKRLPWLVACGLGWGVALAAWHLAGFLLTVTAVLLAVYLLWRKEWRSIGPTALVLGGVTLVVGLAVPALRVKGLALSPGACLLYLTALVCLVPRLRRVLEPRRWRTILALVGGAAVIFIAGRLLWGQESQFGHVYTLFWDKLLFLGQKPADPARLSWISRALWSGPFDGPTLTGFLSTNWLLLPFGAAGAAVCFGDWRRGKISRAAVLFLGLTVALLAGFLFFRRLEVFLAPMLALAAAGLITRIDSRRKLPLVVGLAGLAFFNVYQSANIAGDDAVRRVVARLADQPRPWPHDIGDELRVVIAWLRENTPPDAVLAARYNIAPMLLAYADRPVALHSIWESSEVRERARRFTLGQFGDEGDFEKLLAGWGVDYLVVSAADSLDFGPESARYEADALRPVEGEAIAALCLFPEELTGFDLQFQTPSFRVYAVGDKPVGRPFYGDSRSCALAGSPPDAHPVGAYSPLFDPASPIVAGTEPADRGSVIYAALDDYNLGASLYNGGRHDQAVPRFRRVLERVGDLNRAGYWLAAALYRSGDPAGAEAALDSFLGHSPGDMDGLLLRAEVLRALGRSADALVELQTEIARLPDEPRLYDELAEVYRGLGDFRQAELLRQRAREVAGA